MAKPMMRGMAWPQYGDDGSNGRDPRALFVGGRIDLVNYQADHRVQLARCRRAVERFTRFENQPATAEAVAHLLDVFLDAVVVLFHFRDWFTKQVNAEKLGSGFGESPAFKLVADMANASKHVEPKYRRSEGQGVLWMDPVTSAAESLAEFYRRMRLVTDQGDEHPADFLRRVLQECDDAALVGIVVPKLERGGPTVQP